MIALLDTGQNLDTCEGEIGLACGQLLTPLTRYRLREEAKPWAIDNGAFSRFDRAAFFALLAREEHHKADCLFVAVPDVVGSARRTLEVFDVWRDSLVGWKRALVIQDGQEDLPIPWDLIHAVFIGGTSDFKMSESAVQIIKAAQIMEKWVHVGRVNTPDRVDRFMYLGVDSIDGSGIARYSHMRRHIEFGLRQGKMELECGI